MFTFLGIESESLGITKRRQWRSSTSEYRREQQRNQRAIRGIYIYIWAATQTAGRPTPGHQPPQCCPRYCRRRRPSLCSLGAAFNEWEWFTLPIAEVPPEGGIGCLWGLRISCHQSLCGSLRRECCVEDVSILVVLSVCRRADTIALSRSGHVSRAGGGGGGVVYMRRVGTISPLVLTWGTRILPEELWSEIR